MEIAALLASDSAQSTQYESEEAYAAYLSDPAQPTLPWETKDAYRKIVKSLAAEVRAYEKRLGKKPAAAKPLHALSKDALKKLAVTLRNRRQLLQEEEIARRAQSREEVETCICLLDAIFEQEERPTLLEKLSALGLHALNDARKIQPNYPVGDDNEPTFTAPANVPDIECFYGDFNAICEVTMLTNRSQWYNEGQPVMRHLRDFEDRHADIPSYCLFIAPKLHRDTINTFWTAGEVRIREQAAENRPASHLAVRCRFADTARPAGGKPHAAPRGHPPPVRCSCGCERRPAAVRRNGCAALMRQLQTGARRFSPRRRRDENQHHLLRRLRGHPRQEGG